MNHWFRRILTVLVALVVGAIVVVGTGVGVLYAQGKRAPTGDAEYVALGSSFAAGPGVGHRAPDSPTLCIRSATNYPHLIAKARDLELTDVTCSGATAENVLDGGQYFQPPQLDALKPTTKLVTVTVGGNDVHYLGNLFGWSCQQDRAAVPFLMRREVCTVASDAEVDKELAALPARLDQIAKQVHKRSPQAQLVFADYTTVLPESGSSCPKRLPITDEELQRARQVAAQLAAQTTAAAQRNGALLAKVSKATEGHDICSADPWVFGFTFTTSPLQFGPPAYHPTQKAMKVAADTVLAELETTR